jgi:hypothetical protein
LTHTHQSLLAASLRDRAVWDAFRATGEAEQAGEDLAPVVEAIREYYDADAAATFVDTGILATALRAKTADPKRLKAFDSTLEALRASDVSVDNAWRVSRELTRRRVGEKLAVGLLQGHARADIDAQIVEYLALTDEQEDDRLDWDGQFLRPDSGGGDRVPVLPSALNDRLRGGLLPGHHMTVFGRPEVGKSALALTIGVGAANKGHETLYLGNEDPPRDLMLRALQIFANASADDVAGNLDEVLKVARRRGAARLRFHSLAPGSLGEIERLVRKYRPRLVVLDQLRNISTGKTENLTQTLDKAAQGLRAIGKRHGASVVSVTQAGDSARNKAVLDDGDVDSSNTGVSAGCDVLVGIGATADMRGAGKRMLTLCKNKLGGIHEHFPVTLDPLTLRIKND